MRVPLCFPHPVDRANVGSADHRTAASSEQAEEQEFPKLIGACLEFGAIYSIPAMNGEFSLSHLPVL